MKKENRLKRRDEPLFKRAARIFFFALIMFAVAVSSFTLLNIAANYRGGARNRITAFAVQDGTEAAADSFEGGAALSQFRRTKTEIELGVKPSNSAITNIMQYDSVITAAANAHGIPSSLVKAVIIQESDGLASAVSPKGAVGLMQLMPCTARDLGLNVNENNYKIVEKGCTNIATKNQNLEGDERADSEKNVFAGAKHLAGLLKTYENDIELALAAYNWGGGNVRLNCDLKEGYITCKSVPRETEKYVSRVINYYISFGGDVSLATSMGGGQYYSNPSFRTSIKYSLGIYEDIKTDAQHLITACAESSDDEIITCIEGRIEFFNRRGQISGHAGVAPQEYRYSWSFDKTVNEELVISDFVENYRACLDKGLLEGQDSCICSFSMDYPSNDFVKGGNYILELAQREGSVLVSPAKPKVAGFIPLEVSKAKITIMGDDKKEENIERAFIEFEYGGNGKIGGFIDASDDICISYGVCGAEMKNECKTCNKKMEINPRKTHSVYFLKKEGALSFLSDTLALTDPEFKDLPRCDISPTRYFKFAVTENKPLPAYDPAGGGERGLHKPKIRFALFLGDNIPPDRISDSCIESHPSLPAIIGFFWKKSDAGDLKNYKIYLSDSQISNLEGMKPFAILGPDQVIERDRGYVSFAVTVEAGRQYYYAITAEDTSGNEDKSLYAGNSGNTKDSLCV